MDRMRTLSSIIALLFLSSCGDSAEEKTGEPNRSLILITLDTTRADALGCYGSSIARTPTMDTLAEEGSLFSQARTPIPITLPSHSTILTGLLPPSHGIRNNAVASLDDTAITLADRCKDAGLSTGAFVSTWVLDPLFGLHQGFNTYSAVPTTSLLSKGQLEERPASETIDHAIQWIEEQDGPFFLWVHLFDPHAPYNPPEPFASEFSSSPYAGEVAYVDSQLDRLLNSIQRAIPDESYFLALTADHGESMGEHDEDTHALFVYDTTLHVPLIFKGPGIPMGVTFPDYVSTADIAPTLVELMGLPALDTDGRTLSSLFRGETLRKMPIYFESYYGFLNYGWSPLIGILSDGHKWIEAPRPEFFDIPNDPGELNDRFGDPAWKIRGGELRHGTLQMSQSLKADETFANPRELSIQDTKLLTKLGYNASDLSADTSLPYPNGSLTDPKDRLESQRTKSVVMSVLSAAMQEADSDRKKFMLRNVLATHILPSLQLDPENAIMLEFSGTAHALLGDYERAVKDLDACLRKAPERLEARFTLGWTHAQLRNVELAYAQLEFCLAIRPSFVKASRLLAQWEEFYEHYESAIGYWESFLEHWSGDPDEGLLAKQAIERLRSKIE